MAILLGSGAPKVNFYCYLHYFNIRSADAIYTVTTTTIYIVTTLLLSADAIYIVTTTTTAAIMFPSPLTPAIYLIEVATARMGNS